MDRDTQPPTNRQQREQAREQRKARERAVAERDARRKRLKLVGIASTVAAAAIVLVLIASAGAVKQIAPESSQAKLAVGEVTASLHGIPQSGSALGRATAPVTLQYYGDLECPVCRSFTTGALPAIISRWVRPGTLRVEYHSLETATREPEVFADQQVAALAAGRQDKLWNFLETFYQEQGEEDSGYVTESFIGDIARQVPGMNLSLWAADRHDPKLPGELATDAQMANLNGLDGTPAFLIGRSGATASRFEPSSFTEAAPFNEALEKLVR
jgi:protein-disulfide isomerase